MSKRVLYSLCLFFGAVLGPNIANAKTILCDSTDTAFRIGVLYQNTDARARVLTGVEEALNNNPSPGMKVCIKDLHYTNRNQGLKILKESVLTESVDLIIGPTESDIFVTALEINNLSNHHIPVISPLVVAPAGNNADGWFFRTNADVKRRSEYLFDYLQKKWIRSVAVLYANTEFGRAAESSFKNEMLEEYNDTDTYLSLAYDPAEGVRFELRSILQDRPEAVGIFGEREDIAVILRELQNMSQANPPYKPLMFTVLDASQLKEANGLHYVSITKPEYLPTEKNIKASYDDIKALAYDTTHLTLNILTDLKAEWHRVTRKEFRTHFRDQLAIIMSNEDTEIAPKTGLTFNNFNNQSKREIYQFTDNGIKRMSLYKPEGYYQKLEEKAGRVLDRFGYTPVLALLVLLIVAVTNSTWDLVRWYEGEWWKVFTFGRTYLLFLVHFALGAAVFIVLAETGKVRYDSLAVATVIGFAPSQFLRIKLFETKTGKDIGLVAIYDWILSWLNDGMMVQKYKKLQDLIDIIAHYNSEKGMVFEIQTIYSHHINNTQKLRLEKELQDELNSEQSSWVRRTICARELLKRLDWEALQARSLLPPGIKNFDDYTSPIALIRKCRHYLLSVRDGHQRIDKVIENEKNNFTDSEKEFYERKLEESPTDSDKLFTKIRFLVLKLNYNEPQLLNNDLLVEDYDELAPLDYESRSIDYWKLTFWKKGKKEEE